LKAVGRLIRGREEERTIHTLEKPAVKFDIMKDVGYAKVVHAANRTAVKAFDVGLGKSVVKSDILTFEQEAEMLMTTAASPETPHRLNNRYAYYCTRNFFVRGGTELRNVDHNEFKLMRDEFGEEYLRYNPLPFYFYCFNCIRFLFIIHKHLMLTDINYFVLQVYSWSL